jgi:hypothetical protein
MAHKSPLSETVSVNLDCDKRDRDICGSSTVRDTVSQYADPSPPHQDPQPTAVFSTSTGSDTVSSDPINSRPPKPTSFREVRADDESANAARPIAHRDSECDGRGRAGADRDDRALGGPHPCPCAGGVASGGGPAAGDPDAGRAPLVSRFTRHQIDAGLYTPLLTGRAEALEAALRQARDYISEDRDCLIDRHTVGGDLATLDDFDKQFVDEADRVLREIDAALGVRS